MTSGGVPELAKALLDDSCHLGEGLAQFAHNWGKIGKCFERVVPKSVDFDWLANARRDFAAVNSRIHPGQLDTGFARVEQAIRLVNVNAIACPLEVAIDDLEKCRKQSHESFTILRGFVILTKRLDVPECGIDGVVLWTAARIGEAVGKHAAVDISGEQK